MTMQRMKESNAAGSVPVERILHDAVLTRPVDQEKVDELKASFRSKGQQQPIKLRPDGEYYLRVTFGEHRLEAAKQLAAEGTPIKGLPLGTILAVVQDVDEHEALELKVTENAHRNGFVDPWEEGRIFARLLTEKYDGDLNALSRSIGKNTAYIRDRTSVYYNLAPELRQYVGNKLTIANTIALAKSQDRNVQLESAKVIIRTRTQNLAQYGGGNLGGTVKVRPYHLCTCGCGDVHPMRNADPIRVDVGEGDSARVGTRRGDSMVHLESPANEGYSLCGFLLSRRWVTAMPSSPAEMVTENVKEPRELCEPCFKAWRAWA